MLQTNTSVRIAASVIGRILDRVARTPDCEVCGLLVGGDERIEATVPARNVAAYPARYFEIDPETLFATIRAERGGGPRMIGHYHSHPGGIALPSPRDAADATEGALWLIVAGEDFALFRSVAGGTIHGMFVPVALDVT